MSRISAQTWRETLALRDDVRDALRRCDSLEAGAQELTQIIYGEFSDSLVLSRLFVTVPYCALPAVRQEFVDVMAQSRGANEVHDETPVLSLLGSCGQEPRWKGAAQSQGHLAIPLTSTSFVAAIPMIAQLLQEMEVELDWLEEKEVANFAEKELGGGWIGIFYARDAGTAVDARERHVISDQDFVTQYGVKTVFGLGGIYPEGAFFTLLFFTNETLEKAQIEPYKALVPLIASNTSQLLSDGKIFAPSTSAR